MNNLQLIPDSIPTVLPMMDSKNVRNTRDETRTRIPLRAGDFESRHDHPHTPAESPTQRENRRTLKGDGGTRLQSAAHDSWIYSLLERRAAKAAYKLLQGRARKAVKVAVASGLLTKPSACTRCKSGLPPEAHHLMGYEERNWLNVLWLCHPCHVFSGIFERQCRREDSYAGVGS